MPEKVKHPIRNQLQRKVDTLRHLDVDKDLWIATTQNNEPHLIPLNFLWLNNLIFIATELKNKTGANLARNSNVCLALGHTRDVIAIKALVVEADPSNLASKFENKLGWNPITEQGEWRLFALKPMRIQAWRNIEELNERTIMLKGNWVV